jgi:transcriptional regulator of arginine metabolism
MLIMKKTRQGIIVDVIRKNMVRSQEELADLLQHEGVETTQATLSRDIRELGLVKIRGSYQDAQDVHSTPPDESLRRAFAQYVIKTGISGNIVMIKTSPGNAHSIGAVLDAVQWPEVLGTVAGDDTIFVLLKSIRLGAKVLKKIQEYSE